LGCSSHLESEFGFNRIGIDFMFGKSLFLIVAIVLATNFANIAFSQDVNVTDAPRNGVSFANPITQKWKVGAEITGGSSRLRSAFITIPVPMDWPEQSVRVVEEDVPSNVTGAKYRVLDNGVRQMVANIVGVPPRETIEVSVTFEVTINEIVAPSETDEFVIPKTAPRGIKRYLNKSILIDHTSLRLKKQVKEIVSGIESPWKQVEALYDWVLENTNHAETQPEGAKSMLRHLEGPPEDMVNLFVAFCRAHRVPARTVWVEGHVYAEFYLQDAEKKGHWFPAQLSGRRDFGSMSEPRIIQQKGDNIKVPEEPKRQRYVSEHVTANARSRPRVKFIRELVK